MRCASHSTAPTQTGWSCSTQRRSTLAVVVDWSPRMSAPSISSLENSTSVVVSTTLDRACRGPARKPMAVPRDPPVRHPTDLANAGQTNRPTDRPPPRAGIDQHLGDGQVPADDRAVGADPLQRCLALLRCHAQCVEIGQLIRLHRVEAPDVPLAPVRTRRAKRAVAVEQQHRTLNAHPFTAPTTG